jgi:hypothetical protein
MGRKETDVLALIALCEAEGGPYAVGEAAGVSGANLWQITKATPLPSGEPKGIGKYTADKLTAAFPGWRDLAPKAHQAPELPATSTILLSLSDDAVTIGAQFDKSPIEIREELHSVLTDYISEAKREFVLHGRRPQYHQSQTPAAESQTPATSRNAPEQRAGVLAARSKIHSR